MSSVTHYGHGVYCYACQAVYEDTDGCEHGLDKKAGVQKTRRRSNHRTRWHRSHRPRTRY